MYKKPTNDSETVSLYTITAEYRFMSYLLQDEAPGSTHMFSLVLRMVVLGLLTRTYVECGEPEFRVHLL